MALLQRRRHPDSESQGPAAIGSDAVEQGPGLTQILAQDRPPPIDVGEIVARFAQEVPLETVRVVASAHVLHQFQPVSPDLGNGKVEADAFLGVDALGTVDTGATVFSQFVLPMGDPKVAGPLEAGTVQVIESHADPVLQAGFVSPFQRELPGIDALVQQPTDAGLLFPLADVKKAVPIDPRGLANPGGKQGDRVTESEHVADDGADLGAHEPPHGFVDEILRRPGRSGIEEEAAVVVVEQRRQQEALRFGRGRSGRSDAGPGQRERPHVPLKLPPAQLLRHEDPPLRPGSEPSGRLTLPDNPQAGIRTARRFADDSLAASMISSMWTLSRIGEGAGAPVREASRKSRKSSSAMMPP